MHYTQSKGRPARGGFTLVELLVVVAIIAVLAALTAAGVLTTLSGQAKSNTVTLLQKTQQALEQQWSEAHNLARKESVPASVLAFANGDARRAEVIYQKLKMKQQFPMTYAEALNPGMTVIPVADLPPLRVFQRALLAPPQGTFVAAKNNPTTQSAALLLIALQQNRNGKMFEVEQSLGANAIRDTDGDGLPELIDGFGIPITFYRWGTGNMELDASNLRARTLFDRDNEDPSGLLMDATWFTSANAPIFEALCHPLRDPMNGQRRSFHTIPTIVSSGRDKTLGLTAPFNTPMGPLMGRLPGIAGNAADDNLYGYLADRVQAKRGE